MSSQKNTGTSKIDASCPCQPSSFVVFFVVASVGCGDPPIKSGESLQGPILDRGRMANGKKSERVNPPGGT
ncbi:hypothetical protein GALMADRAFT_223190 [Galerina marginata CBS 339.88]|uniref:Uncharacterized protein n=1 Tax=Galerina marginata (strain CBS 339.88) TaxID=685588 RepID=A0A067TK56_GALM3|nr:hypothetical protein GALMADRAFT_223190 [Galerina marginata CBS 339.88]